MKKFVFNRKIWVLSLSAIAFGALAADTGLDLFNAKKSQVKSYKAARITSSNGATSNVGTGAHWEETVKRELSGYNPDTSDIEAKLRSEFTAADNSQTTSFNQSISQTNANVSSLQTTTNSKITNLTNSTNTQINNLKNSTNSSITSINSSISSLSGSLNTANNNISTINGKINTINSSISASNAKITDIYAELVRLESLIGEGGGGPAPGTWITLYSGAGTNSITVPEVFNQFRFSASYEYREGGSGSWIPTTVTDKIGYYLDDIGDCHTHTASKVGQYGTTVTASAQACIKTKSQVGTLTWLQSDTASKVVQQAGVTVTAKSEIRYFKITKLEVKY